VQGLEVSRSGYNSYVRRRQSRREQIDQVLLEHTRNAYLRMIVGWALSQTLRKELVIDAFETAVIGRKPKAGLIFHSNRGSQYSSNEFQTQLQGIDAIQSMSDSGSYDNAICETVFHTIKCELVHLQSFGSRDEA
jgi:putative transposase